MANIITDTNKFDRMIRTYGIESMQRIQHSSVYILGLSGGCASEICKNLALSSILEINLIGSENINLSDTISSMYYKTIGDKCSDTIKQAINKLNSTVNVNCIRDMTELNPLMLKNSVMIVINKTLKEAIDINVMCRSYKCKMVYMMSHGLAGSIFVDCLTNHIVTDLNGENKESVPINSITNNTIHCATHNFNTGDTVRFRSVDPSSCDYLVDQNWIISDFNTYKFTLVSEKDGCKLELPKDFKFINGVIEYIPKQTIFNHSPLNEAESIKFDPIIANLDAVISNSEGIFPTKPVEDKTAFTNDIFFGPVVSIMGGLVSTEVLKLISKKYTPITQWYTWSDYSIFPSKEYTCKINIMSHYHKILDTLSHINILMIGCGALGCEWLKNLAMLGCCENGQLDIVDLDHIEHSNTSRQFLFGSEDIGQSKSKVAAHKIKDINSKMNIISHGNKLTPEDSKFTDKVFGSNPTCVISALDNIQAREYVDSECFNRDISLFESGTTGMKASSMPIIPHLTETYSNMSDSETVQYPVCTIKSFPNDIIHTIHWAKDNFEQFNRGPSNYNKFIEDPNFLDKLSLHDKNQAIDDINCFLDRPSTWEECCYKAKEKYEQYFYNDIEQLLHVFPRDHMVDGKDFWSHGKLCPSSSSIDHSNECINYMESITNLYCQIYKIKNIDRDSIIKYICENPVLFKMNKSIKTDLVIAINDAELDKTKTHNISSRSINGTICTKELLNPQYFDKDDEKSMYYVYAASNCRAVNYGIQCIDFHKAKGIAGNIIPAVVPTTSFIVGLIGLELLKYISYLGHEQQISDYRSWFVNMADNTLVYSQPFEIPSFKIGEQKINGWTKHKYNTNSTLQELVDYCNNLYKIPIYMILYKASILYSNFDDNNINNKLDKIFKDTYNIDLHTTSVMIVLVSNDDIEFPPVILSL